MLPEKERWPKLDRQSINKCFGCGQENPIGLKLSFSFNGDKAEAEFTPNEFHQGWTGIVHGGIIYALLDEVMSYALYPLEVNCVTAKCEVRFNHPAPIGETLLLRGTVIKKTRKLIQVAGTITLKDGTKVAEGTALMYVVNRESSPSLPSSLCKRGGWSLRQ